MPDIIEQLTTHGTKKLSNALTKPVLLGEARIMANLCVQAAEALKVSKAEPVGGHQLLAEAKLEIKRLRKALDISTANERMWRRKAKALDK